MKFSRLFGIIFVVIQTVCHGSAMESLTSTTDTAVPTPVKDHGLIVILIQKLSMQNFNPVNIGQISTTMQYCQQRIEIITELIVSQYPSSSAENLLALLSTIHDVFDAISETTNNLESSLNGFVGCIDLVVLDVQIAVQVLVEAFISNCDILEKTESGSVESIDSAVFCLSSAVQSLLMTMSDLAEKILASEENVDENAVTGLQMIVQAVLNIVNRVMFSLKRVKILDLEDVEPSLDKFSLIIQRLATQRLNFATKIPPMILSRVSEVSDSLSLKMDQLSLMTDKSIESMVEAVTIVADRINEKNISPNISSLLNAMQPMFSNLSTAIHSIHGISDSEAYSTDVTVHTLMATIKCLTYYMAVLTKVLPTVDAMNIGATLQSILCFIASNIQTLVDAVTLAVERAFIDLICSSTTIDKAVLEKQLLQLQGSMEPVILTLENVVRTSIELVQNIMSLGACALGDTATDIIDDMNRFINNLRRIVKELTETVVSSKQLLVPVNRSDVESGDTHENVLSICIKSIENVAQNSVKLRVYFNKSIEQIRKFLIEM